MQVVSIVGVGLIGASFGLALRKAGFSGTIVGVSSPASVKAGMEAGAIEDGISLEEAAAQSDLIYLSQPIEVILQTLPRLGPILRPGCLVTDAGSTKTTICEAAQKHLPARAFLGGHPMAGKEQRGAQAASADLFLDRPYVFTPVDDNSSANADEFRDYIEKIGAKIFEMTPEEHDRTVALTSHLPQLLSTALSSMLGHQTSPHVSKVFGPGLIDMTRLALSAPEVWMSVLATNYAAIDESLSAFQTKLKEVREQLGRGMAAGLFQEGSDFATRIRGFQEISLRND
jgi:prephenate dehydrogenase